MDTGVIPEDGLGTRYITIGDVHHPQVVAVIGLRLGALSRVALAPRVANVNFLSQIWISGYFLVEEGLHLLDGLIAAVKGVENMRIIGLFGLVLVYFDSQATLQQLVVGVAADHGGQETGRSGYFLRAQFVGEVVALGVAAEVNPHH